MQAFQVKTEEAVDDIDGSDAIFIEDFENDDVVYFRDNIGMAINIEKKSLLLFERIGGDWYDDALPLSDLRDVKNISIEAAEYINQNQFGGARGIGQGVAVAIRNASEQSKARRGTGVELHFRSVERPSFLINIADEQERARLMEALRQVNSDGYMKTPYRVIPNDVREAYRRITQVDIEQNAEHQRRALYRKAKTRVSWLEYAGLAIVSLLVTFPIFAAYKNAIIAERGHFPDINHDNAILIFFAVFIACRLLLGFAKGLTSRGEETRVESQSI